MMMKSVIRSRRARRKLILLLLPADVSEQELQSSAHSDPSSRSDQKQPGNSRLTASTDQENLQRHEWRVNDPRQGDHDSSNRIMIKTFNRTVQNAWCSRTHF